MEACGNYFVQMAPTGVAERRGDPSRTCVLLQYRFKGLKMRKLEEGKRNLSYLRKY